MNLIEFAAILEYNGWSVAWKGAVLYADRGPWRVEMREREDRIDRSWEYTATLYGFDRATLSTTKIAENVCVEPQSAFGGAVETIRHCFSYLVLELP